MSRQFHGWRNFTAFLAVMCGAAVMPVESADRTINVAKAADLSAVLSGVAFLDYVRSEEAVATLRRYGFSFA